MEEPDVPWEMDEYWAEETKDRSMVSRMFHKGLAIGKKMLITGMIISSAPVVVPPLIVMSALGFVVSLPYGIILASYTCSERLLDKLLPGTPPPFSLEEEVYSAVCKEVEEDYRFVGAFDMEEEQEKTTDEIKEDFNVWTEMIQMSEEPGGEVIVGYQETIRCSPITEQPSAMQNEEVALMSEEIELDPRNSEIAEASIEVTDVILMGDGSGKGDNQGGLLVEETKGLITGLGAQGNAVDSEPSNDKKLEHGVTDKIEIPSWKKSKRKGRKKEKAEERKPPKVSDETTEVKRGSVQPVTAGSDAKKDDLTLAKDDDKFKTSEEVPVHSPIESTVPKAELNSARELIFPFLNEDKDAEGAIWQRIEAVRRIVGYRAARQATCIEELRALYLFTGVEPPVSFKDASDLAEVNKKLQLLMSVVGVM